MFFVGAIGEELGWQDYAVASLSTRCTAVQTGLVVGVIWAAWHIIPYLQTLHTLDWVAWQCAQTVLARLLIVWLSNNTGRSVIIAIIFHTMINVSEFMFGSNYDSFLSTMFVGIVVSLVVLLWGARTLSRFRFVTS
jgi:membrane protease YdiL (CAAX protease family)